MINKNSLYSEFSDLNKDVSSSTKSIILQNQEIYHVQDKLKSLDNKAKVTEKYISGFNSFFGFFPKLFSWGNKTTTKEKKNNEEDYNLECKLESQGKDRDKGKDNYINNNDYEDELEREIKLLNQNAKTIRNEINKSIKASEELNININKSSTKIEKLKKEANKKIN